MSETERLPGESIPEEDLVGELQRLADELGHPPTSTQMREQGRHAYQTYRERYGGWRQAIEAADLDPDEIPNQRGDEPTPEEDLVEELERVADELGRPPTTTVMRRRGKYGPEAYKSRFGTWDAALEAIGIDRQEWLREQGDAQREGYTSELQRLADELGRTPAPSDMDIDGEYSSSGVRMSFDSWDAALRAAGLEPPAEPEPRTDEEQEYVEAIQEVADEIGRTPSKRDMTLNSEKSPNVGRRLFGSWNAAVRAAGLEENTRKAVTEEEYLDAVRELADELDGRPTSTQMNEQGQYSSTVAIRLFGSWSNALEEAGFDD